MRQIHEGKYEVLCYHKKKEFKCFTFINKFLFWRGRGWIGIKNIMLLKISLYILRMQYMWSQSTLEFLFVKPLFLSFKLSLYWWIFKIGSKLFVLKISIAWKKLIQWLTVDELYICNDISLHIWKKRCLNFRQTLKTKWKQKMQKWGLRNRWQMPKKNENKRSWFFRRIFKCVKFGVCVGIVTVHSGS